MPEVILRLADIETAAELLNKALIRKLKMLKLAREIPPDMCRCQGAGDEKWRWNVLLNKIVKRLNCLRAILFTND